MTTETPQLNKDQSWVDKYAGNIIATLLLTVLIWIGVSVSETNKTIVELKAELKGQSLLNTTKDAEFDRRLSIVEDWKNRQQELKMK